MIQKKATLAREKMKAGNLNSPTQMKMFLELIEENCENIKRA